MHMIDLIKVCWEIKQMVTFLLQMRQPEWSSQRGFYCIPGPKNRSTYGIVVGIQHPKRILENSILKCIFSGRNVVENNATKSLILDEITIGFPSLSFIKSLKIYVFQPLFSETS
mgnify:CR=1 FL=1